MQSTAAGVGIRIQRVCNTLKENGQDSWAARLAGAYYSGTGKECFEATVRVLRQLATSHIASALSVDEEARSLASVLSLALNPDKDAIPTDRELPTQGASSLLAALRGAGAQRS